MARHDEIKKVLMTDNRAINRRMCSFMKDETLHYLVSFGEDMQVSDLPEPYKSDVIESYKKAKGQIK